MRDDVSLLIVLWAIYLIELIIWLPKNAVLFSLGKRKSPAFADNFPGNASGSLRLNHIVPWFQLTSMGRQPLVAFSPEAFSNQFLGHWTRTQRQYTIQSYTYSQIQHVSTVGTTLILNQKPFVNCKTIREAERHKTVIQDLVQTPQKERHKKILEYYQQRFHSADGVSQQIEKVKNTTRHYRTLSSLLFAHVFIVCPLTYYLYPYPKLLLYCLLSNVLLGWALSYVFYKSHRTLYPEERHSRFQSVLKQFFCFPIAIGAGKDLCLNSFVQYDPTLIAKHLLSASEFEHFCRKVWLDLKYPIQSGEGLPFRTFNYAQSTYRNAVAVFLQQSGFDLHILEKPAKTPDPSSTCYCPRCHAQFEIKRSHCTECPGILTQDIT